jgi:hypothetical protein
MEVIGNFTGMFWHEKQAKSRKKSTRAGARRLGEFWSVLS